MAAGRIPAPGTEHGPCESTCPHTDCAANRRMAAVLCVHCSKPIGYEVPMYNVTPSDEAAWSKLAHQACELEAVWTNRLAPNDEDAP